MFNNFKNIFSGIFSGDIAIDLGTANTIVWIKKSKTGVSTCIYYWDRGK